MYPTTRESEYKRFTIWRPDGDDWKIFSRTNDPNTARAMFMSVKTVYGDAWLTADPPAWNVIEIADCISNN